MSEISVREDGLETEVTENGPTFGEGERKLISLVRALLKEMKILVLDEATAHLDVKEDVLEVQDVTHSWYIQLKLISSGRMRT